MRCWIAFALLAVVTLSGACRAAGQLGDTQCSEQSETATCTCSSLAGGAELEASLWSSLAHVLFPLAALVVALAPFLEADRNGGAGGVRGMARRNPAATRLLVTFVGALLYLFGHAALASGTRAAQASGEAFETRAALAKGDLPESAARARCFEIKARWVASRTAINETLERAGIEPQKEEKKP